MISFLFSHDGSKYNGKNIQKTSTDL